MDWSAPTSAARLPGTCAVLVEPFLSDLCHIFDSMFEDLALVGAEPVLARLGSALDELAGLDLTSRSGEQLLALLRGLEEHSRRLAVVDQALVAQVDRRGVGC